MNRRQFQIVNRIGAWIGLGASLIVFTWLTSRTGPGNPSMAYEALRVLFTSMHCPLLWLGAAIGFGWPLRAWLMRSPAVREGVAIQIGLGVAAMLVIDAALGTIGFLQWNGSIGAWVVIVAGIALLIAQVAMRRYAAPSSSSSPFGRHSGTIAAVYWLAAPAIGVLLIASCSAPGWLWSTEFGGYDALSYHLELPREWLALGRIAPLHHNVYSFLPGYVEAAYYHIATLTGASGGGGIHFVYSCQLLHAMMTLLSAWMLCRLAAGMDGKDQSPNGQSPRDGGGNLIFGPLDFGRFPFVLLLGTPWVIVVGSLGYNEMAVAMMLIAGMLIIRQTGDCLWHRSAALGLVAGVACGAKLTALGMAAFPLVVLLLLNAPPRRWLGAILFFAIAATIVLSPYLIRNFIDSGNPVFPFASSIFGLGHWTAEQHVAFARGHISDLAWPQRLAELWDQVLRFGFGPNPYMDASSGESATWKPQWSILPWLAMFGIALGFTSAKLRRWSIQVGIVFGLQVLFWLFFTHLKSRFMLPGCVPMVLGTIIGGAWVLQRSGNSHDKLPRLENSNAKSQTPIAIGAAAMLLAWASQPAFIFAGERGGSPAAAIGRAGVFTGDDLNSDERRRLGASSFPAIAVNFLLPDGARVLMVGDAAPLYYRLDRIVYQTTWDRGPLSQLIREFPDSPEQWRTFLLQQGFSHLLVNQEMLERWERAGWNDPLLTRRRVVEFAQQTAVVEYQYGSITIYRLRHE